MGEKNAEESEALPARTLEVLNGLREGEHAVAQPPGELEDGDPVRVVRR